MTVVLKFFSKKIFFARGISKVPEPCAADHPTALQKTAKRFFARGLAAAEDWRPARH